MAAAHHCSLDVIAALDEATNFVDSLTLRMVTRHRKQFHELFSKAASRILNPLEGTPGAVFVSSLPRERRELLEYFAALETDPIPSDKVTGFCQLISLRATAVGVARGPAAQAQAEEFSQSLGRLWQIHEKYLEATPMRLSECKNLVDKARKKLELLKILQSSSGLRPPDFDGSDGAAVHASLGTRPSAGESSRKRGRVGDNMDDATVTSVPAEVATYSTGPPMRLRGGTPEVIERAAGPVATPAAEMKMIARSPAQVVKPRLANSVLWNVREPKNFYGSFAPSLVESVAPPGISPGLHEVVSAIERYDESRRQFSSVIAEQENAVALAAGTFSENKIDFVKRDVRNQKAQVAQQFDHIRRLVTDNIYVEQDELIDAWISAPPKIESKRPPLSRTGYIAELLLTLEEIKSKKCTALDELARAEIRQWENSEQFINMSDDLRVMIDEAGSDLVFFDSEIVSDNRQQSSLDVFRQWQTKITNAKLKAAEEKEYVSVSMNHWVDMVRQSRSVPPKMFAQVSTELRRYQRDSIFEVDLKASEPEVAQEMLNRRSSSLPPVDRRAISINASLNRMIMPWIINWAPQWFRPSLDKAHRQALAATDGSYWSA
jgi:hypothetical protein